MGAFEAFVLGILQGLTEFLPVSSSGHLIIGESLLGLEFAELKSFDVAVHMGTLMAILIYFWKDILGLLRAVPGLFCPYCKKNDEYSKLIFYIMIGTIPAVLAGVFLEDRIDLIFRDIRMVAFAMIIIGIVFFLGEFVNGKMRASRMTWWKALIIGLAQAVALIPGVSRSGSTIVAGLFQGINREKAARFSFLLGAPAIFGAGIWTALGKGLGEISLIPVLVGFFTSAATGFLAVWGLMKFLKNHSLNWFGGYLIVVGVLLAFLNFS
jgi:undecaprenyl-diphosphatase